MLHLQMDDDDDDERPCCKIVEGGLYRYNVYISKVLEFDIALFCFLMTVHHGKPNSKAINSKPRTTLMDLTSLSLSRFNAL